MADRRNKTARDMSISMGVIVVSVLLLTGLNGGFSFSPGRASGGNTQTADVGAGFSTAGRVTGFAVIVPKGLPATWHGSSFSITPAPGTPDAPSAARGGWLTAGGAYITLVESSGAPAAVLAAELGSTSGQTTGSVTAGGANWTISPGVRQEVAWSRRVRGVTLLITGNATTQDFSTLAAGVAG